MKLGDSVGPASGLRTGTATKDRRVLCRSARADAPLDGLRWRSRLAHRAARALNPSAQSQHLHRRRAALPGARPQMALARNRRAGSDPPSLGPRARPGAAGVHDCRPRLGPRFPTQPDESQVAGRSRPPELAMGAHVTDRPVRTLERRARRCQPLLGVPVSCTSRDAPPLDPHLRRGSTSSRLSFQAPDRRVLQAPLGRVFPGGPTSTLCRSWGSHGSWADRP